MADLSNYMNTNPDNTVTISLSEYNELIEDQELLQALQAAGVDNWDGYDLALEFLREDKENEE